MKLVSGAVRFEHLNKDVLYNINDLDVKPGDIVVVETDFGLDMGLLTEHIKEIEPNPEEPPMKKILRVATEEDFEMQRSLSEKEEESLKVCEEEVAKADLGMKLVSARYSFDGSKVTFCYTADARVDFRELVKALASRLQTRIELRQVGVRDEARLFGGYGPCGRKLCCSSFLRDFTSVSIKMAKEQGLPLNPMKISGICGRLFCCLKYEYDEYVRLRKLLPDVGDIVTQGEVKGRVTAVNVIKHSVNVATESGGWTEIKVNVSDDGTCCGHCACKIEKRGERHDDIPDDAELRALEDGNEKKDRGGQQNKGRRNDGKRGGGGNRPNRGGDRPNRGGGGDRPNKNGGDHNKPERKN